MALQSVPVPPEHGEDVQKLLTADAWNSDDGTCSTYACVCLPAAWNCACGTSAVVHACTHGYIRMFSTRVHGSAINAWFDSCIYVRTYTSPLTCPCPCPIRRRRAGQMPSLPTPCRRSDPCPCLIPGLDRVTRRPGGRRHARGASACYGTGVYICMAVRCAARGEGVRVRGRHHALRYYSARPLLAAAHSTLRSIWPCVHACRGEHYSRHTRLPHMASWTTVSRLAHVLCTLNFVFRLFLAESFFFSLRAGKCTVGDIRHGTRYTRTIQCTFSRSCSIALFCTTPFTRPNPNDRLFFF